MLVTLCQTSLVTYKKRFVLCTRGDVVEFTSLNDFAVNGQFLLSSSQHELFHRL